MSYNINNVIVAGRLVADPEARTISGDEPISAASYRVAVNRRRGKDGQEQADFFTCESFGPQAEFLKKYMKKGAPILVEGWLKTESYEDNAGVRKHSTKVVGKRVSSERDGNLNWNSIQIAGRLTRDPELRTGSGTNVAKFSVAVDRNSSKKEADFINCACFGKMAETAVSYLKKGKGICLRGRLQVSDYVNKDGIRTWQTEVIVEDFRFTHTKAAGTDSSDGSQLTAQASVAAPQAQQTAPAQYQQAVTPQPQQAAPVQYQQAVMPQPQQAAPVQSQQAAVSQPQQVAPVQSQQATVPQPQQAARCRRCGCGLRRDWN